MELNPFFDDLLIVFFGFADQNFFSDFSIEIEMNKIRLLRDLDNLVAVRILADFRFRLSAPPLVAADDRHRPVAR
jgi:hypothetical protein